MPTRRPDPISSDPLLSVVMPVYNERTTVEEIIRRVLAVPITYAGDGYDERKKITWRAGFEAFWVLLEYRYTE